jgi:integrase
VLRFDVLSHHYVLKLQPPTLGANSMQRKIPHYGRVLTDRLGMPRYWAATWGLLAAGDLADSTIKTRLSNVEAFYVHAESDRTLGCLDDAIGRQDFPLLEEMLASYFVSMRNVPRVAANADQRWRDAVAFVREVSERLSSTSSSAERFAHLEIRLTRLERLYGQLRMKRKTIPHIVRALPASVLSALYDAILPGSASNPFKTDATQWRAFAAFLLLLHQGLRRGEVLTLPANFLKHERTKDGTQFWLNVRTNEYEDVDRRHSTPSIKTVSSIRQIPVSQVTATALLTYIENYRGRQAHPYFLSSAKNHPLSAEGLNYFFKSLSTSLSAEITKHLFDRTGMNSISPHDLRHTAAVIRMKQLLARGDPMPEALQKMRSFFGWAASSTMPQLYAKAAFEERLSHIWSDEFDDRVAMLSSLPEQL